MNTFEIAGDDFLLDGEPHRILSGALHYFRVHPDDWADRIHKARLMGLNTIETYVPWNAHEAQEGEWRADGPLDLDRFLRAIADEGMHAIVRPGPYICAEWDNGGLPAWLFTDPEVGIRRSEPKFVAALKRYLQNVLDIVRPLQITEGGPVVLVQVENEYGAYGDDTEYLQQLADAIRDAGITVPLMTVDQPEDRMLENGSLPGVLKTASFGSRSRERLATLRRHQPTGPLMCSEFWDGWFDSWGGHHHTTPVAESAAELDELLALGASVNVYMFHGGTNFGFTNGANDKGVYQPIVTSYDYDAPLDEAGEPTEKYWAFRDVIAKHAPVPELEPVVAAAAPSFTVPFDVAVPLWAVADRLGDWVHTDTLPTFDQLGHYTGFGLYRTEIDTTEPAVLEFGEVRDRAYVSVGSSRLGVLARDHHDSAIALSPSRGTLTVLVEDQGRVDYGIRIGEPKGLVGPVQLNGEELRRWSVLPLQLSSIDPVRAALDAAAGDAAPERLAGPVFARAVFDLEEAGALFLDTTGWGKGVAWINGFNLGRYWTRGPQQTLYVPRGVVRAGRNELIVLELESAAEPIAAFVPELRLGHTEV
ncbi:MULTISPECIES: beta-galactosidase family protein [unclassified Leifsonia]|uniref:glycoside hydrolase family 35 protein n=1 Tax=unclassified Leifsonia TaxID=2663824 RepID=UPI0008A7AF3B|nr:MULTISPECIES: beta-galactosidase family protein [unclassified Leifsonia]SEH58686.1 beta-galactosidase [Leifsonia sp. CL154]SFL20312.1 beta-galactosidase [Leifsonia sp. CL147]